MNKHLAKVGGGIKNYFLNMDKPLFIVIMAALVISLLAINSATSNQDNHTRALIIQSVGISVGTMAMIIISKIDYDILSDFSPLIIIVSSAALLITAIIAPEINGNKNWIMVGPVNIQPSEFTKICFAVTMSTHLTKLGDGMNKLKNIILLGVHFALYFIPIVLQGDIGTALVYLGMFSVLIFVAGIKYRYIIIGAIIVLVAIPIIWEFLKVYQKERILYGFQPELDPLGRGYQPLASRMAIGSGQLFGLGYLKGIQSQNDLLPAIHTDFIYAIIGEEGGFILSILVLLILISIILLIFRDGYKAKDQKGFYICIVIASMIMFQTIINIGMCIGVAPVIGVTLPFFSYGGSSVLSLLMAIGLVQAVRLKPDRTLKFTL